MSEWDVERSRWLQDVLEEPTNRGMRTEPLDEFDARIVNALGIAWAEGKRPPPTRKAPSGPHRSPAADSTMDGVHRMGEPLPPPQAPDEHAAASAPVEEGADSDLSADAGHSQDEGAVAVSHTAMSLRSAGSTPSVPPPPPSATLPETEAPEMLKGDGYDVGYAELGEPAPLSVPEPDGDEMPEPPPPSEEAFEGPKSAMVGAEAGSATSGSWRVADVADDAPAPAAPASEANAPSVIIEPLVASQGDARPEQDESPAEQGETQPDAAEEPGRPRSLEDIVPQPWAMPSPDPASSDGAPKSVADQVTRPIDVSEAQTAASELAIITDDDDDDDDAIPFSQSHEHGEAGAIEVETAQEAQATVELEAADEVEASGQASVDEQAEAHQGLADPEEASQQLGAEDFEVVDSEEVMVLDAEDAQEAPPMPAVPAAPAPPKKKRPPKPPPPRRSPWYERVFNESYANLAQPHAAREAELDVDFVCEVLQLPEGAAILDIGSGTGRHAFELADRGFAVTGIDYSLDQMLIASQANEGRDDPVTFLHGDMRALPSDREFDAVLCLGSTLGYFSPEENQAAAAQMLRCLRPGGRLMLEVFNRDNLVSGLPTRSWWQGKRCLVLDEARLEHEEDRLEVKRTIVFDDGRQYENLISIAAFTARRLKRLLERAGFEVDEISGSRSTRGRFYGTTSPSIWVAATKPMP